MAMILLLIISNGQLDSYFNKQTNNLYLEHLQYTTRTYVLVGEPRDQNKANFNKVRQIAKFGMIVCYKIVINNLILRYIKNRYKKIYF